MSEEQTALRFDGDTFDPELDTKPLTGQWWDVFMCMKDGRWRTLGEIVCLTLAPEASISARLRDFRKKRFGAHTVNRRRAPFGRLHEYQLVVNKTALAPREENA